tara:strand:- start:208 stop:1245 length:1038 start_codon:yes stop_codon:yes gene_type:complete
MIKGIGADLIVSPSFYFKGSDIKVRKHLTTDDILAKISEYEIFKKYCSNFKEVNRAFCSELRKDRNPSAAVSYNRFGSLIYYDFSTKQCFNCFSYIQQKYGLDFKAVLTLLDDDLGLSNINYYVKPEIVLKHVKIALNPTFRYFNLSDYNYWIQYGIKLTTLLKFNVYPCSQVDFDKEDYSYTWFESLNNPIYSYKFIKDERDTYKIYRPYDEKYNWYSPDKSIIQGWDQMPKTGDLLIITKALKDCMSFYELGITAIAPQSESILIKESVMSELKHRFKTIITLFDYDNSGIHLAWLYRKQYGLKPYFLTDSLWNRKKGYRGCKDISDYFKKYGENETKKLLNG